MKKGYFFFLFIAIILASVVVYRLKNKTSHISNQTQQPAKFMIGFPISGYDTSSERLNEFFALAFDNNSDVVSWEGPSSSLANTDNGNLFVMSALSKQYSYTPIYLTDQNNRQTIIDFAKSYQPAMLGVGNEVNRLDDQELEKFISDFPTLVDEIKKVSPDTLIITSFQYENLIGRYDGLLKGESSPKKSNLELLRKFDKADMLGFSSYPGLIYKDPQDIPEDYYSQIKNYTDKSIIFTGIAWPSDTEAKGWESSEDEQSRFVEKLPQLMQGVNVKIVLWSLLYDQQTTHPFTSIGLINRQGNSKKALEVWKTL